MNAKSLSVNCCNNVAQYTFSIKFNGFRCFFFFSNSELDQQSNWSFSQYYYSTNPECTSHMCFRFVVIFKLCTCRYCWLACEWLDPC